MCKIINQLFIEMNGINIESVSIYLQIEELVHIHAPTKHKTHITNQTECQVEWKNHSPEFTSHGFINYT